MCLSVLVRLIAGPVTNHDSSGRERRGHTTLGSVSGACYLLPYHRHPLWLVGHPPAQLLRFATKSMAQDRRAALLVPYLPDTSSFSSFLSSFLSFPVTAPPCPFLFLSTTVSLAPRFSSLLSMSLFNDSPRRTFLSYVEGG